MNKIGDIRRGHNIGIISSSKYIYWKCDKCGREGWKELSGNNIRYPNCKTCSGKLSASKMPNYHEDGIIYKKSDNRTWVRLDKNDPYYPMVTSGGCVLRARLVMAKSLGRLLATDEIVHHKDRDTNNDDISNLELCHSKSGHAKKHYNHTTEEVPVIMKNGTIQWYISKPCIDCGKDRLIPKNSTSLRCYSCSNKHATIIRGHTSNWKGGISKNNQKEYQAKYRKTHPRKNFKKIF